MRRLGRSLCRICGYDAGDFLPWGEDGKTPSCEYCPCCGVEWGYQDSSRVGVEKFRAAWLAQGAPWRGRYEKPDGLDAATRLRRLGIDAG